jgi:cytochrome P450
VPGGTNICSNTGAVLRSRSLFGPDADVFRPERFTELDSEPRRREMERNVELAFGSGQWQCVGRRIAFMKLSKTVFEVSSQLTYVFIIYRSVWLSLESFNDAR